MNTDQHRSHEKHRELTDSIIRAFYTVYNTLGYGFLEKVYVNALLLELKKLGIRAAAQVPIQVYYDGQVIGEYCADLVIDNRVLVEIKAARTLLDEHEAQVLNYLKATRHEVGLLMNFGPQPEIRRKVYDNERKGTLAWVKGHE